MHLKAIKLAGFKSFVDPTTIQFVSNLTAVVGPNGCGKSNVIDAVRWVMGESSAKNLRSGALTDVIFTGSSTRKPVGQATVELLFENVAGRLGGEYAGYSEIAIKRLVTRDGQSQYFLNNQRCRRKDITDIFLGTGLGPRSYAIIEQGMISKVIEAKPEDLRNFIEEAAGVSKYKERRRETENRIKHTQDNLARLNDLQDELDKQLRHLERQSQAAARYQEFKITEKKLSAELASLAWQRLDREVVEHENVIRNALVKLGESQANSQQLKTTQEKQRLLQSQANEQLNEIQKRYYGIGAEIAKIEQALAHHEERREQLKFDRQEMIEALQTAEVLLAKDQETYEERKLSIEEAEPLYEESLEAARRAQVIVEEAECALEAWRERGAALSQAMLGPSRLAEGEKAKIAHLEKQIQQIQERIKRLEVEYQELNIEDPIELEKIAEQIETLLLEKESCIEQIEQNQVCKVAYQDELKEKQAELSAAQQRLYEAQGQFSALETLQAAALGKHDEARKQWLREQGIDDPKRVAQLIQVNAGWETSVETVLEGYLEAIGVTTGEWDNLSNNVLSGVSGIHLFDWRDQTSEVIAIHPESLLHQIVNKDSLPKMISQLLAQVCVANDVTEARALLSSLPDPMSVITAEGVWIGKRWIKLKAKTQAQNSVLIREEKLKQLTQVIATEEEKCEAIALFIREQQGYFVELESERERLQQEKNRFQQESLRLESDKRIRQSKIEQTQKRQEVIHSELLECQNILQDCQRDVNHSRSQLHVALEQMAEQSREQETLAGQRFNLTEAVLQAKNKAKETSLLVNEISLKIQTYRTQKEALQDNIQRFSTQINATKQKLSHIEQALEKIDEPILSLRESLEINLEKSIAIEDELSLARDQVAKIDNEMREIEKTLSQCERTIDEWREKNERVKMQWQALTVHRENVLEKLNVLQVPLEEVLKDMPDEANEAEWQTRLTEIEQKIQRLGPINLAAIEEYDAALQRKQYLDSQLTDLTEALTTLENAIKKIDKEIRAKFQETFEKVHQGFERLFPKLFGGGQASLIMTGEDLLDAGITVMARPPGKKNSTIQLLSGGEKALTAVALVFAIFELNPAPFCMLDEVDAPLDDNNVGRFCNLVKEMSNAVQFIYVSHNKLAIEMAEQLQGVTMREPGVSRLVTVDIEEAKSLVEA